MDLYHLRFGKCFIDFQRLGRCSNGAWKRDFWIESPVGFPSQEIVAIRNSGIGQGIGLDVELVGASDSAAGHQHLHAQCVSDLPRIDIFSFVTKSGASGRNLELRKLGKAIDDT